MSGGAASLGLRRCCCWSCALLHPPCPLPLTQALPLLACARLLSPAAAEGLEFYTQWVEEGVGAARMQLLDRVADAAKRAWLKVGCV